LGLSLEAIAEALDLPPSLVQPVAELFYGQNITAFIELLKNQRSLFSAQDLADLAGLIAPLPDRIEDLSSAIALWCKQEDRSVQRNALKQVRQTLSSDPLVGEVNSSELTINKQILLETL
jgi:hypothetical protein